MKDTSVDIKSEGILGMATNSNPNNQKFDWWLVSWKWDNNT